MIVDCESRLEDRTRSILLARQDLHDLREQFPCIAYAGQNGDRRQHTFDFLATFRSGRRFAIAVKPKALADRQHFSSELALVAAATPRRVADEVMLITDTDIDNTEARNAARYLHIVRTPDAEADHWLACRIETTSEACRIGDLISASGMGGRTFRAVFKAIYAGYLSVDRRQPITADTIVRIGAVQ
ncbi:TnsA endonuclease N-terminal domain-containing protein [Palleronia aestuarii]|uniref:TnsA endonuclease N-terminal domain-containing protein n=1 Tax=Palleronia aestuarii TaxID=568105 RepID=UPI0011B68AD2|nr:TnsA endonuclease N-terminal domain-containing protein [Palleronia aestuarii]